MMNKKKTRNIKTLSMYHCPAFTQVWCKIFFSKLTEFSKRLPNLVMSPTFNGRNTIQKRKISSVITTLF